MEIERYLEKIGYQGSPKPTLKNLKQLQMNHMRTIPFENLNILNDVPIVLDIKKLYEKVIEHSRGGICFELNALFNWLLQQFGYEVTMISATVAKKNESWYPWDTHMANIVTIEDHRYLTDVGFGDSCLVPLSLNGQAAEMPNGKFRVRQVDEDFYHLEKNDGEGWAAKHRFKVEPRTLSFFKTRCEYIQYSPESHFTHGKIVTKAVSHGRVTLTDDHLIITDASGKTKHDYKHEELEKILRKNFGIG